MLAIWWRSGASLFPPLKNLKKKEKKKPEVKKKKKKEYAQLFEQLSANVRILTVEKQANKRGESRRI